LQKPTIDGLVKRLEEQGGDEIICNMAAWFNQDRDGKYITIQISPPFKRPSEHMTVNEFFKNL
jgi:hypothetical protein